VIQLPPALNLSKFIETRFFDDRPHIRGRRIPIATIAYNYRTNGWSVSETAENFGLDNNEVLAALLFYNEHSAVIDAQEQREQALFDEAYRQQEDIIGLVFWLK
jgi:uncharacterized protein (DUF433 family)